jgi:hypothetical protein
MFRRNLFPLEAIDTAIMPVENADAKKSDEIKRAGMIFSFRL